jgi:hypothetical protein
MSTPVRRPSYRYAVRALLSVLGGSWTSLAVLGGSQASLLGGSQASLAVPGSSQASLPGGSQASLPVLSEYQPEIVSRCSEASIIILSSSVRSLSLARSSIHICSVDYVPLNSSEYTFRILLSIPGKPVVL